MPQWVKNALVMVFLAGCLAALILLSVFDTFPGGQNSEGASSKPQETQVQFDCQGIMDNYRSGVTLGQDAANSNLANMMNLKLGHDPDNFVTPADAANHVRRFS